MWRWGIEVELLVVAIIVILGADVFAPFEVETPAWKKVCKWSLFLLIVLAAYPLIGHWILLVIAMLSGAGATVHWRWCRAHGIDPWRATPRRRYYALRGWTWPAD